MKTPFPKYDEELVLEIEEHLLQGLKTNIQDEMEYHPNSEMAGLKVIFARGHSGVFQRPMFQVLNDNPVDDNQVGPEESFTGMPGVTCQCGDFSRSWNCPDHHELEWDWVFRTWKLGDGPEPVDAIPLVRLSTMPQSENQRMTAAIQQLQDASMQMEGALYAPPRCSCAWCLSNPVDASRLYQALSRGRLVVTTEDGTATFSYETERDAPLF